MEEKKGVAEFWLGKRKLSLATISTIKIVDFYVNDSIWQKKLELSAFFILKKPKKIYLSCISFLFWVDYEICVNRVDIYQILLSILI
jgi:hypothetical protein